MPNIRRLNVTFSNVVCKLVQKTVPKRNHMYLQ